MRVEDEKPRFNAAWFEDLFVGDQQARETEEAVAQKVAALRVLEEARRRVAGRHVEPVPSLVPLAAFLDTDDPERDYRIESLWPVGGRVMFSAPMKAGKSHTVGNLLRALVDGDRFLGAFDVGPVRRVVLLDDELDERTLRRWLREQGIVNVDRVFLVSLRGRVSTFNPLDPSNRARWAELLQGTEVLLFDCLRPILDALGLSEDKDAGRFLVEFDALLRQADIGEALIVHHMGHSGERSRGDSRLRDWPDVEWRIVYGKADDQRSARYFSAYGRDVDVPEGRLSLDGRRVTYEATGDRIMVANAGRVQGVVDYVNSNPGCSASQMETALGGKRELVRNARDLAESLGRIRVDRIERTNSRTGAVSTARITHWPVDTAKGDPG